MEPGRTRPIGQNPVGHGVGTFGLVGGAFLVRLTTYVPAQVTKAAAMMAMPIQMMTVGIGESPRSSFLVSSRHRICAATASLRSMGGSPSLGGYYPSLAIRG